MNLALTVLITLGGVFGSEPRDSDKVIVILNDTHAAISVSIDGGDGVGIDAKGAGDRRVSDFGMHSVEIVRADGVRFSRRFNLGPVSGFYDPPHAHRFCVTFNHSHMELLDPQTCYVRVKRLAPGR